MDSIRKLVQKMIQHGKTNFTHFDSITKIKLCDIYRFVRGNVELIEMNVKVRPRFSFRQLSLVLF